MKKILFLMMVFVIHGVGAKDNCNNFIERSVNNNYRLSVLDLRFDAKKFNGDYSTKDYLVGYGVGFLFAPITTLVMTPAILAKLIVYDAPKKIISGIAKPFKSNGNLDTKSTIILGEFNDNGRTCGIDLKSGKEGWLKTKYTKQYSYPAYYSIRIREDQAVPKLLIGDWANLNDAMTLKLIYSKDKKNISLEAKVNKIHNGRLETLSKRQFSSIATPRPLHEIFFPQTFVSNECVVKLKAINIPYDARNRLLVVNDNGKCANGKSFKGIYFSVIP